MKQHLRFLNAFFATAILFALLFQSVHSISHFEELASVKCHHSQASGKTQITHQHHSFDHCIVCSFSFSGASLPQSVSFDFFPAFKAIPYFSSLPQAVSSASQNIFRLRGPPVFIV